MGDEGGDGWVFITGIIYTEFVALQDTYLLFIFKQKKNMEIDHSLRELSVVQFTTKHRF